MPVDKRFYPSMDIENAINMLYFETGLLFEPFEPQKLTPNGYDAWIKLYHKDEEYGILTLLETNTHCGHRKYDGSYPKYTENGIMDKHLKGIHLYVVLQNGIQIRKDDQPYGFLGTISNEPNQEPPVTASL